VITDVRILYALRSSYGVCKINNGKQLTVYEHFALVNIWTKVHHVAWKSLVRIFSLAEFCTFFFTLANFRGPAFQKLYQFYHPYLTARRMEKFCEDTPISPEVLFADTLNNFKPDFKFSRLKFFRGTPVPLGVCTSKRSSISSACKNMRAQHPLRAEILYAKKCILVGPNSLSDLYNWWTKVHQTFFLNAGGINLETLAFRFGYLEPFRRYSRSKWEVA